MRSKSSLLDLIKKTKKCAARDPLLYGSRECFKNAVSDSDLCVTHRRKLHPHQLINGILYIGDEDE